MFTRWLIPSLLGLAVSLFTAPSLAAEPTGTEVPLDPALGYPDLAAVEARLKAVQERFPAIARWLDLTAELGTPPTVEGRHLQALKISDNVGTAEDEPGFLLTAALHAREVGTPLVALEVIDRLASGYGNDAAITRLIDGHQIWIVPVGNPDGYAHVFAKDASWRKNRRPVEAATGVDLNRNFPFGWSARCAGSVDPREPTYKGPSAGSEVEVMTLLALWERERFAKSLDVHSFGPQVVFGHSCLDYPFFDLQVEDAGVLSQAAGLGGSRRTSTGTGEMYQHATAIFGAHSFLLEVGREFTPPLATALEDAAKTWPGVRWMLERPVPLSGQVRSVCDGNPLAARIRFPDVNFTQGERHQTGRFGRYFLFMPPGTYAIEFSADGYQPLRVSASVSANAATVRDVTLMPQGSCDGVRPNPSDEPDAGPPRPDAGALAGDAAATDVRAPGTDARADAIDLRAPVDERNESTADARSEDASTDAAVAGAADGATDARSAGSRAAGCRCEVPHSDKEPFSGVALGVVLCFVGARLCRRRQSTW